MKKWSQYDKNQVTNLIVFMKRAKFEVVGMEAIVLADVFKWISDQHDDIEKSLAPSPPPMLIPNAVSPMAPASVEPKKLKKSKKRDVDASRTV